MAKVNFRLHNVPNSQNKYHILLDYYYVKGKRLRYGTDRYIRKIDWFPKKQRTRYSEVNDFLEDLAFRLKEIQRNSPIGQPVNADYLKKELAKYLKNEPEQEDNDLLHYFKLYIQSKRNKKERTVKKIITTQKLLIDYTLKKRNGQPLFFPDITKEFEITFSEYCYSDKELPRANGKNRKYAGQTSNSYGKYMETFKQFMQFCLDNGFTINDKFKTFVVPKRTKNTIVPLEVSDIQKLIDYTPIKSHLQIAKDLFLMTCFTALRYSDVIGDKIVDEGLLFTVTEKTNDSLSIPLNNIALEILHKYNNQLPVVSNVTLNKNIKTLCKEAGLTELTPITKYTSGEGNSITVTLPKYKLIKTKTGRQSYITISIEDNLQSDMIRSVTGHKTEKVMQSYYDLAKNKKRKEQIQKNWNIKFNSNTNDNSNSDNSQLKAV